MNRSKSTRLTQRVLQGTRRRYSSYNIAVAGLTEAQEEVCPLILSPRPGNRISNDAVASI